MHSKSAYFLVLLAVSGGTLLAPCAEAESILGTSISVTSVFDNEAPQQFNFGTITSERIDAGIFSDWMTGIDSGTNIELIPGVANGDETRNELEVNFSGNDQLSNPFQPGDTLTLTFQLGPGIIYNTGFMAITVSDDVQVPDSSVDQGTFTFEMTNLDQINGNGGQFQLIFDVEPTPEPGTLCLGFTGCAMLLLWLRRQRI